MAKYTLDEAQREIVETALIIYEDSLAKLWKRAVANRVDTADIDGKLAVIRGDDERAGLLRIFAKELPEQRDAFHDKGAPELTDEELDEVLDGIEEEAAERIKAQEDEAPDHELVEEIEPAPSNEGEKQEHAPEPEDDEEAEEEPDLPFADLDLPYMRAFVDAVPAGLAPDAPREAIEAALIAHWSKAHPVEGPSGPEAAPIGGWWWQHPSGRLVPCRVDPMGLRFWYDRFTTGATPSLQEEDTIDAALLVLHARSRGILEGADDDAEADPFAGDPDNPFAAPVATSDAGEEEGDGDEGDDEPHDGVLRAHATYSRTALEAMKARQLKKIAGDLGLEVQGSGKQGRVLMTDLIDAIYAHQHPTEAEAVEEATEQAGPVEEEPAKAPSDVLADRPTVAELEVLHAEAAKRIRPPEPDEPLALALDVDEEEGGVPAHLRDVPVVERACLDCLEDYGPDGSCPECGDLAEWATAAAK